MHQVRTARTVSLPFPKGQAERFLVRVREMMVGMVGNDLLKENIRTTGTPRESPRLNERHKSTELNAPLDGVDDDVRQGQFVFVH